MVLHGGNERLSISIVEGARYGVCKEGQEASASGFTCFHFCLLREVEDFCCLVEECYECVYG